MSMRGRGRARVTAATAAIAISLACSGLGRLDYERQLDRGVPGAQHALHDERLRAVMRSLDRLQSTRLPQMMDVGAEADARRSEIAEVARAMAGSAGEIEPPGWLDPSERAEFAARAARLEAHASAIAAGAESLPADALRDRVEALQADCDGCHDRFGVLQP